MNIYYLNKLAFKAKSSVAARWQLGELLQEYHLQGRIIKNNKENGLIEVSGVSEDSRVRWASDKLLNHLAQNLDDVHCRNSFEYYQDKYNSQGQRIIVLSDGIVVIREVSDASN